MSGGDTNDTNEMWRAVHREQRERADRREAQRLRELKDLAAIAEVTQLGAYHFRVRLGSVVADYWPRTGATRIVGRGGRGPTRYRSVPELRAALVAAAGAVTPPSDSRPVVTRDGEFWDLPRDAQPARLSGGAT